ncbi:proline hydroxylase [Pseudomonas sp. HMWF010]|nr:proline hydroxylase [Pseudomonas sp. HMWF010]
MTAQAEICINPGLDPAPFAEAFARDGVVQIPVFLRPADADAVATLLSGLTWNVVAPDETSDTLVISSQVIQKFGEAQVRQFLQGAIKRASRGFSFVHLRLADHGGRVQASNYRPGDFLTLHDDSHRRDDRLAAFTLGFTREWRPDWGGQLLFHDADGQIERGFMPGFNVLTLFRVPRPHSVAPVAPYAAAKRLSLTGWLVRESTPPA